MGCAATSSARIRTFPEAPSHDARHPNKIFRIGVRTLSQRNNTADSRRKIEGGLGGLSGIK
jgi:hypothetical protein